MAFRIKIDIERCKGCALCAEACPKRLFAMSTALNPSGAHFAEAERTEHCTGCMHCAIICPDAAIEIEEYEDDEAKPI